MLNFSQVSLRILYKFYTIFGGMLDCTGKKNVIILFSEIGTIILIATPHPFVDVNLALGARDTSSETNARVCIYVCYQHRALS